MRSLKQWFSRAAGRLERVRFVEDALLTRRYSRYAFFRLRYFLGISLAELTIHIIEFTILAFIFSRETLLMAILLRAVGGLGSAWWWGALESMREDIRGLRREGKSHRIDAVASRWLCLAVVVSAFVLFAAMAWIVFDTSRPLQGFTVFHLFALAIAVQLALSIVSRTYHSIVYSVRRVYRPFMAILGVRMFAFAGTIIVWPLFGQWSFPLMLLATSALATGLTFHYVRRMYRTLGFSPLRIRLGMGALRLLRLIGRKQSLLAGFAYVVLRFDTLIIIMLFPKAYGDQASYNLFLFFYLILPLVHSAYGWAQLFYFDLKRLDRGLLVNLRKDFDRFVRGMAWWVGGLFGVIASVIGTLLVGRNLGMFYLPLMLFFLFRSRLAFSQIRFFSEHRYGALIAIGALLVATVLYAQLALPDQTQRFGFYTAALVLAILATTVATIRTSGREINRGFLSLPDWIGTVRGLEGRVRVRSVCFAHDATDGQIPQVVRRMERATSQFGAMTRIGRRNLAWFETGEGIDPPTDDDLMRWSGGLLEKVTTTPAAKNGVEAFAAAQDMGIITGLFPGAKEEEGARFDVPDLLENFRRRFPDGVVLDLTGERVGSTSGLSPSDCRDIMFSAMCYSRDFSAPGYNAGFDVSTLLVNGEIRLIFAIPMRIAGKARQRWRGRIKRMNLAIACGASVRV